MHIHQTHHQPMWHHNIPGPNVQLKYIVLKYFNSVTRRYINIADSKDIVQFSDMEITYAETF